MPPRLPIESIRPVYVFFVLRVVILVAALLIVAVFSFPYDGKLAIFLVFAALPFTVAVGLLTRHDPRLALHPLVAAGDLALLLVAQLLIPEGYGATHFVALFLIAVHSHLQGGDRSSVVALGGSLPLAVATLLRAGAPVEGQTLVNYEIVFVLSAVGTGIIVGRLRTTETASRLRAKSLTRRTIEAERELRRRVAESIHDGPVQELIALDMILSSARGAALRGDGEEAAQLMSEAHEITQRNVRALRDEIVDLGPYAFEELTFDVALSNCIDAWRRRWDLDLELEIDPIELPPETAADLFHITQEAVVNAGRHAEANRVDISLRSVNGHLRLTVADDGRGFDDDGPLALPEPGHLGLTSMRQRAELLDGELSVESSGAGTTLVLTAPLTAPRAAPGSR